MKTIKNIKELSKLVKSSKKYIIMYILLSILISAVGIIGPLISAKQLVSITEGNWNQVVLIAVIIFILSIFRSLVNFAISFCSEKFSKIIIRRLQIDIASEILKIKVSNIDKYSNGLFIQRMTNDATSLASIFTFGVDSLTSLIADLGVFIVIYVINIWVGLYLTLFIIIFFVFSKLRIKIMDKLDKTYRTQRENTSGFATELIRGIRDIKMLNARDSFINSINESVSTLNDDSFKLRITGSLFGIVSNFISSLYEFTLSFKFEICLFNSLIFFS